MQVLEMVLETGSGAIEFFDENIAARMKKVINYAEEERFDDDVDFTLREKVVRFLCKMSRTYVVSEFRPAFDNYVKELEDEIVIDYEAMCDIWGAAKNDQADVLKSILHENRGIKINEQEEEFLFDSDDDEYVEKLYDAGKNALHFAADAGSCECIRVLLDAGANVKITATDGNTALHFAAGSSNIGAKSSMEILVDSGLSLDAKNNKDWTVLHFAAFSGHPKNVQFLLGRGLDPHLMDRSGRTAYHMAAENGSGEVLKSLLDHGRGGISGIYVSDVDGIKPAELAVRKNRSDFIEQLLKHLDMKELIVGEEPFLLFVAREGSAEMMKVVLDSGPDIFSQGTDHSTILHSMAKNRANFGEIMKDVIKKGVHPSATRNDGSTPLHLLLSGLQPATKEILEIMMDGNPKNVDDKGNNYLMCLWHSSRPRLQKKDIALDLIELGVNAFQKNNKRNQFYYQYIRSDPSAALEIIPHINDLKRMDKAHWKLSGWLTIHFAITKGSLRIFEDLLKKGSLFSKQTRDTQFYVAGREISRKELNCMHVAALYGQKDILECILRTSHLSIDCRDGGGGTALHLAALSGSDDCVRLLLSEGADAEIQDLNGDSVLHYAIDSKSRSVVETLVEAKACVVANQKGDSPIDLAKKNGQDDIAELMQKHHDSRDNERNESLSSDDETLNVVASDLPFRFGSKDDHFNFEFYCLVGSDVPPTMQDRFTQAGRKKERKRLV